MDDDEDDDAPSRSTWVTIATTVLAVAVGNPLVDRYGWVDGLLRLVAITALVTLAIAVDWRPVIRNWRRTRDIPLHESAPLFGNAAAGVLYLVGSFALGEPGPGGVLCVAALVLLGLTAVVTIASARRKRISASA